MKQRRPDDVIRCSADADPMSKTIIGPMKLSVIGPMKHPSRARHRADEVVLVGNVVYNDHNIKHIYICFSFLDFAIKLLQTRATEFFPNGVISSSH